MTPYGVLQEDIEGDGDPSDIQASPPHIRYSDVPLSVDKDIPPITTKQKLYVLGMQGVGAGLVNVAINMGLAYAMYRQQPGNTLAFTGQLTCVVSDVIVTAFLIPCLTGIIGTALIRNDLRVGKLITPIDHRHLILPLCKRITTGQSWLEIVKRSILFGFIGVAAFAPITLLIIYLCTGTNGMQALWTYVIFKGYWSGIEATILSPILAFIAIAQDNHHTGGLAYTKAHAEFELTTIKDTVHGETYYSADTGPHDALTQHKGRAGDNIDVPSPTHTTTTAASYIVT